MFALPASPSRAPNAARRLPDRIAYRSPSAYNGKVGLALLCPVTSQRKGYPFEVALPAGLKVQGVVLADQVKSLDWQSRRAERIESVPSDVLDEAVGKIRVLIEAA